MHTGTNISNLLQQQGAARAGGALASGQAFGNVFGNIAQLGGSVASGAMPNLFGFAGGPAAMAPAASMRPMARPF
jgi:hypothetical protein